jgi:hypothetical protein
MEMKANIMTTEFVCSALAHDGQVFQLETCAACVIYQAIDQFRNYVHDCGGEWDCLVTLSMTAIEVDC